MVGIAVIVQSVLPAAMLCWLAFARMRSTAVFASGAFAVGALLLAIALTVPALFLPWWLPIAFALLGVLIVAARLPALKRARRSFWPAGIGGRALLTGLWLVSGTAVFLSALALDGWRLPQDATIDIPLPLGPGTYLVANGGSREIINPHMMTLATSNERFRRYRGQSYGIDLVEIDAFGLRSRGLRPADPAAYEIYGNAVYAPCDGKVVASRNDRPDMTVPAMDRDVMEGNHVLLRCGDIDLLLAHCMPGSVQVEPGDLVHTGQELARVGNSGNSAEPHLHISAQRAAPVSSPFSGEPIPILFDGQYAVRNARLPVTSVLPEQGVNQPGLRDSFAAELEELTRQYDLPGAVAAYVLADGATAVVATGYADVESASPMTPQSRLLAASIGKSFVAATVLGLHAEGVLRLDDPLSRWLDDRPWFRRLPNHADVTLRQLLMHTSGIPDHVESARFREAFVNGLDSEALPLSPEDLVGFVLDQPALFPAGEAWAYSDTGYILLGMVIETATGNDYYDEVRRRFLEPLSLDLTSPSNTRKLAGLASGYTGPGNAFGLPPRTMLARETLAWHPGIEWTGGGLVSNPRDLATWASALFEGRAMDAEYLDELLPSVPMDPRTPEKRYGAGIAIYESPGLGTVYGHAGWVPGYVSFVRYLAGARIAIAFQTNTDVGLQGDESTAIADIESRLTGVVVDGNREPASADLSRNGLADGG